MRCYLLILLLFPLILAAKELGPDVSVYKGEQLKWEEGSRSYYVMFKSLLANNDTANDTNGGKYNPQADICLDSSTFHLDNTKIPIDAYVDRAFLVWTGAVASEKIHQPTDNEVNLSFKQEESLINLDMIVTASRKAMITDEQDFEFESFKDSDDRVYFTYRVDITDIFKRIHQEGRMADIPYFGESLYGDYTVSGLDCTNEAFYLNSTSILSGWAILLVYTTAEVPPRKIYVYNGFQAYQHKQTQINVSGFEFPAKPQVRLTLHSLEGDPGLVDLQSSLIPEGIKLQGAGSDWVQLSNICNPLTQVDNFGQPFPFTEIFNSISSEYGYKDSTPACIGGIPPDFDLKTMEYAMDVDTFLLDPQADSKLANHIFQGGTNLSLSIGANQDWILPNFLILSIDTKAIKYDIPDNPGTPGGREKDICSCSLEQDSICLNTEYYYSIKIQNWGDETAINVTVQDVLPSEIYYIPGTTVIATEFNEAGQGLNWTKLPDINSGGTLFPLEKPLKIADKMKPCNKTDFSCENTVMIRFKVTPTPGLPKHVVISNIAVINDSTDNPYSTNSDIPLRLRGGTCYKDGECDKPDLSKCGGDIIPGDGDGDDDSVGDSDLIAGADIGAVDDPDNDITVNDADTAKSSGSGCSLTGVN